MFCDRKLRLDLSRRAAESRFSYRLLLQNNRNSIRPDLKARVKRFFVDIKARGVVPGRAVSAKHKERRLSAVRLNAARKNGGVFTAAKIHRIFTDIEPFNGLAGLAQHIDKLRIVRQINGFTHLFDLVFTALRECATLDDLDGRIVHVLVDFTRLAANLHLHESMRRNNVAAFACGQLTDVDTRHAATVTGNAKQLDKCIASGGHGISAGIRFNAGMCRAAREGHVELRRAEEAVRLDRNFA